uniref:Uncharacterized protein n=1 Tax=Oryza nivara TaxID=4536 RepID=A0A0E0HQR3_ORYNI
MDLPKVTPTNSSMICSSYDAKSDHTVAIVVTCVTSTVLSMELLSTDGTIGGTNINIPDSTKAMLTNCLTVGLDVKGWCRPRQGYVPDHDGYS